MILNKKRKIILIAVIAAALIVGALVICLVRMNVKQTVSDETI